MKVIVDDLNGCVDCLLYVANGDVPDDRPSLPEEIEARHPNGYIVCDDKPGEEEGWFSWSACDLCGSRLGGQRSRFAILGD